MSAGPLRIRPQAPPLAGQLHPRELVLALWRHRHVVRELGRRQVHARHRGSYLGLAWTVLHPLLLLAVYTLVFTVWLPIAPGPDGRLGFVLQVFCGLVLFGLFAETVQRAPLAVVANPNYVRKAVFPLEVLPLADLWASTVLGALNLAVLMLAVLVVQGGWSASVLWFPLVLPPLLAFTAGIGWFLAALGVYVRDLAASIGVLVTALFFLTPVLYRLDQVPDAWRWIVQLNPLATILDAARRTLLDGLAPSWPALAIAWVVALATAQLGFAWFRATKRGFADVV